MYQATRPDAEGNLTQRTHTNSGEVWLYSYDHRNRLTRAQHKASAGGAVDRQVDYQYDALGNRIRRDDDPDGSGPQAASVAKFAYESGNARADLDAAGSLTTRRFYFAALDSVFARLDAAGTAAWYLTDRLGSVRDIVDAAGTLQDHLDYDPWGKVVTETNPAFGDRVKFTAREWDAALGAYYSRARIYSPEMRRFWQEDPLSFSAGDANLYRYVGNGPTLLTDPSGQIGWFPIIVGIAILAAGGAGAYYGATTEKNPVWSKDSSLGGDRAARRERLSQTASQSKE
ncbi:MAG TPA: RHS repeat-associated core domain-containing protein [Candidatus Obscuribacterales bacterium]